MILSLLLLLGMQRTCCHVFNGECKAAPCWYSTDNPRGDIVLTPSEPLDVPAIVIGHHQEWRCSNGNPCFDVMTTVTDYSCDPNTRILEHDEQPAPHTLYWCRKVQHEE